jgi:hypothetical protein
MGWPKEAFLHLRQIVKPASRPQTGGNLLYVKDDNELYLIDADGTEHVVGGGGTGDGIVETVVAGDQITVDSTDPANPIVATTGLVESVVAGDNITVDVTDPANPIISAADEAGIVESVVAGTRVAVDSTDPANPVVSADAAVAPGADTANDLLGLNLRKIGIVLTKGAPGTWDADLVETPSVIYDPKSGKWVMAYVGYGSTSGAQRAAVGIAYSSDGVTWTKSASNPILLHSGTAGAPDQNGAGGPVLLWDDENGQYVLYYLGMTATGYEMGTKSMCLATAPALTGPWTRHGAVLSPGGSAPAWRSSQVWCMSVAERDGTWWAAVGVESSAGREQIGMASAPSITGPWTFDDATAAVIYPQGTGWEANFVSAPALRRVGDLWVMDYMGVPTSGTAAYDGQATTSDHDFPGGWVRYSGNPILSPTAGSYDAKYAHKPVVVSKGGAVFHYYIAVDASDKREIALAVETVDDSIGEATTPYTLTVQDENGNVSTSVTQIDFQGSGVTATAGTGEVVVTIAQAASVGELLMQDGVTAPPVPIETEAQDDWLYQD